MLDTETTKFGEELGNILNEMEEQKNKLRTLVINYADNHDKLDLYDIDGGVLERKLDELGFINGWVIDRLMHRTENSRGSVTNKIRKAQGYNV